MTDRVVVRLDGHLLDVTDFIASHPGGPAVFSAFRDQETRDITRVFKSMGHSSAAYATAMAMRVTDAKDESPAQLASAPPVDAVIDDGSVIARWLLEVDAWKREFDKKLSNWNASGDTRGYGWRWHDQRRTAIEAAHPAEVAALRSKCGYFAWTIAIGIIGALVHAYVSLVVVPNVVSAAAAGGRPHIPHDHQLLGFWQWAASELLGVTEGGSWRVGVVVWGLAYTVGSVCRMIAFGVAHELVHETVHPFLSVDAAEGTRWHAVRSLLKDIALRAVTLPSVGSTIYSYYANEHLSHHRYLGALDASDSTGAANGTRRVDGDQLSINNLLMKQRFSRARLADATGSKSVADLGGVSRVEVIAGVEIHEDAMDSISRQNAAHVARSRSSEKVAVFKFVRTTFESLSAVSLIRASKLSETRVAQFLVRHPAVAKLLIDPWLHLGHFVLQVALSVLHSFAIPPFLLCAALAYCAPTSLYDRIYTLQAKMLPKLSFQATTLLPWDQELLRRAVKQAWPIAAVGVQAAVWVSLLIASGFALGSFPEWVGAVAYLALSELFVFGFAFHPYLSYFLTVHASKSAGKEAGERCQPTRSIYSGWLSIMTMQLSRHVEHHDFPHVSWWYLPQVTATAPEMYTRGETRFNTSPWAVIMEYLNDDDSLFYACCDCQ